MDNITKMCQLMRDIYFVLEIIARESNPRLAAPHINLCGDTGLNFCHDCVYSDAKRAKQWQTQK